MSPLQESLEEYLATRRAAGFKLHDTATALNRYTEVEVFGLPEPSHAQR